MTASEYYFSNSPAHIVLQKYSFVMYDDFLRSKNNCFYSLFYNECAIPMV